MIIIHHGNSLGAVPAPGDLQYHFGKGSNCRLEAAVLSPAKIPTSIGCPVPSSAPQLPEKDTRMLFHFGSPQHHRGRADGLPTSPHNLSGRDCRRPVSTLLASSGTGRKYPEDSEELNLVGTSGRSGPNLSNLRP